MITHVARADDVPTTLYPCVITHFLLDAVNVEIEKALSWIIDVRNRLARDIVSMLIGRREGARGQGAATSYWYGKS